jgi:chromosome segregation ATPase
MDDAIEILKNTFKDDFLYSSENDYESINIDFETLKKILTAWVVKLLNIPQNYVTNDLNTSQINLDNELNDKIQELNEENRRLTKLVDNLKYQIESSEEVNHQLNVDFKTKLDEIEQLNLKLKNSQQDEQKLKELLHKNEIYEAKLVDLETIVEQLKNENKIFLLSLEKSEQELSQSHIKIDEYKSEIIYLNDQFKHVSKLKEQFKETNCLNEMRVSEANEKLIQAFEINDELNQLNGELQHKINLLESKIDELQLKLNDKDKINLDDEQLNLNRTSAIKCQLNTKTIFSEINQIYLNENQFNFLDDFDFIELNNNLDSIENLEIQVSWY